MPTEIMRAVTQPGSRLVRDCPAESNTCLLLRHCVMTPGSLEDRMLIRVMVCLDCKTPVNSLTCGRNSLNDRKLEP